MVKVSIIIPFYNGAKDRLFECVDSIERATAVSHEILLVNDGSDPEYDEMLGEIVKQYPVVRIVSQENGGVSSARNLGVSNAAGEYVAFVDSDDTILNSFVDKAYRIAKKLDADFLIGKLYRGSDISGLESGSGKVVKIEDKRDLMSHLIDYGTLYHFRDKTYVGRGCVSRLIRRELAADTPFDTDLKVGEDILWNMQLIEKSEKIYLTNRLWYFYHENAESVSNAVNLETADNYYKCLRRIMDSVDMTDPRVYRAVVGLFIEALKTIHRLGLYSGTPGIDRQEIKERRTAVYEEFEFEEIYGSVLMNTLSAGDRAQLFLFQGKKLFNMYDGFRDLRKAVRKVHK